MGIKKPNIKYTPTDINGTINIQAPVNEPVKDDYDLSPDQKTATTDIVNRLYNVAERLANVDKALDEKLANYNIPYDPEQNPLLDEAVKCPNCGDEHAQSAINAESDKKKEEALLGYNDIFDAARANAADKYKVAEAQEALQKVDKMTTDRYNKQQELKRKKEYEEELAYNSKKNIW